MRYNYSMNQEQLRAALVNVPVPEIRFFESIGSTNDEALRWAEDGAPDGALVMADQQTQGRGRLDRRWITRPGAALAFSLVLRPTLPESRFLQLFSPLGAVALSEALVVQYDLEPHIKWPNDVLLNRRKTAGILAEASWLGDVPQAVVLGIGVNVAPSAVPPDDEVLFPATCVEQAYGRPADRLELLAALLRSLFEWRPRLLTPQFLSGWEARLAFLGEPVRVEQDGREPLAGRVAGVDGDGNLLLRTADQQILTVAVGDVHLRPAES